MSGKRYFVLQNKKAESYSDIHTGLVVAKNVIGVITADTQDLADAATSESLALALDKGHIKEIEASEVAKLKSKGHVVYGEGLPKKGSAVPKKAAPVKETDEDEEEVEEEEDETEDDEDEDLEDLTKEELLKRVKASTTLSAEDKALATKTSTTKDKLIELLSK